MTRRQLFLLLAAAAVKPAARPATVQVCGPFTMQVGDVFTIAGVYRLNPVDMQLTDRLQEFRVKAKDRDGTTIILNDATAERSKRFGLI